MIVGSSWWRLSRVVSDLEESDFPQDGQQVLLVVQLLVVQQKKHSLSPWQLLWQVWRKVWLLWIQSLPGNLLQHVWWEAFLPLDRWMPMMAWGRFQQQIHEASSLRLQARLQARSSSSGAFPALWAGKCQEVAAAVSRRPPI